MVKIKKSPSLQTRLTLENRDPLGWLYATRAGYTKGTDGIWRDARGDMMGMKELTPSLDLNNDYSKYIAWSNYHGKAKKEANDQSRQAREGKESVQRVW